MVHHGRRPLVLMPVGRGRQPDRGVKIGIAVWMRMDGRRPGHEEVAEDCHALPSLLRGAASIWAVCSTFGRPSWAVCSRFGGRHSWARGEARCDLGSSSIRRPKLSARLQHVRSVPGSFKPHSGGVASSRDIQKAMSVPYLCPSRGIRKVHTPSDLGRRDGRVSASQGGSAGSNPVGGTTRDGASDQRQR